MRRLLLLFVLFMPLGAEAIWYEASGQATIIQGNREHARRMATEEAIKQALLFSGAKVASIQKLTDGLLSDDRLEVLSGGEVNSVEMVSENYSGDLISVTIRADIFPAKTDCDITGYKKDIATTWFPIYKRAQARLGQLYELGETVPRRLEQNFSVSAGHARIDHIFPNYYSPQQDMTQQAITLSRDTGTQLVLFGEILDLSHKVESAGSLRFWQSDQTQRHFSLRAYLINGITGELLFTDTFQTQALWSYPHNEIVDAASGAFWSSTYGSGVNNLLQRIAERVDEEVACLPSYGRVVRVVGEEITINLGREHGVNQGDQMQVFKLGQFFDTEGNSHYQYQLHPFKVQVMSISGTSAVVESVNGQPLLNIQPNDFVTKR
ncbi:flagella assembly protein FlgT [Saliniradius amylolyticus]|uniref:flagella assembly protein FlgT n=1 Tax=Saliniradius amylolyticus TaxID=2183582 RepID=UPI00194EE1B5|nr:flagella assembly protein FlgT [Saliniradius amylolyticus]